jgi:hypothetical protein
MKVAEQCMLLHSGQSIDLFTSTLMLHEESREESGESLGEHTLQRRPGPENARRWRTR